MNPPPPFPTEDEKNLALLCHLLPIILGCTTGFGFVAPLVLWLIKKDESAFVAFHAKESLNFQLTSLIFIGGGFFLSFVLSFVGIGLLLFPLVGILALVFLVFEIVACAASRRGEWHRYPGCIRFVA